MTSLSWLIPAALGLGLVGLGAFMWALRSGQFEDLDGAAYRILEDDREEPAPAEKSTADTPGSDPEDKPVSSAKDGGTPPAASGA